MHYCCSASLASSYHAKLYDIIISICLYFTFRPQIGQQRPLVRQDSVANQIHGCFPSSSSASLGHPSCSSGIQNQQSFNRPTNTFRMPYCPQQCSPAAGNSQGPLNHGGTWNFRPVGQSTSGMWPKEKTDTSVVQTTPKQQVCVTSFGLKVI